MIYNVLIGGAAGQGMNTLSKILSKGLKRHGYHVLTTTVYMSRIRGGHNYFQIRFSDKPVTGHTNDLDLIIALNQETIDLHKDRLTENATIICDESFNSDNKSISISAKETAKSIDHKKGENILLLGAVVKFFDLELEIFKNLLEESFKKSFHDLNLKAFHAGYDQGSNYHKSLPKKKDDQIFINGNTSIALGAITAGLGAFSAYPMTPSTSIMNALISRQKEAGLIVEQAEDEIAAIHIALGASAAGVRSMTASSGGGLALMVEALGLTAITETPLVIVNVMRPGPATGMPTKTSQGDLSFLLTASQDEFPRMIIAPRHAEDAFYQTIRAFDLADRFQMPVIILSDQYLADTSMTIPKLNFDIDYNQHLSHDEELESPYARYAYSDSGVSKRVLPGLYHEPVIADNHEHDIYGHIIEDAKTRTKMHDKRLKKLKSLEAHLEEPFWIGPEDAETILVGFGSTWGVMSEVISIWNEDHPPIAGISFGDLFPLPIESLNKIKDKNLINLELNATGQLARLIRMETGITFSDSILKYDGLQISTKELLEVLNDRL